MTTATRPALSDRNRTILAAVHLLGTPSAAAAHLGLTAAAVDAAMGRAARTLDVKARDVVRHAAKRGLLDGDPAPISTRSTTTRPALPTYPRGDGTMWAPRRMPHVKAWAEGGNLLALRCYDMDEARRVVADRWADLHGGTPPATGRIVWRRPLPVSTHNGAARYEPAEPLWPRAFPAVLFTPEGA